jgi:hypothetical protein
MSCETEADFRMSPQENAAEFYRMAVLDGNSVGIVDEVFGVTRADINIHKGRLFESLALGMPENDPITQNQRLAAAEALAVDRLDHLYGAAMKAWEQSRGEHMVIQSKAKEGLSNEQTRTTRCEHGQVRYLHLAIRIVKEMSKLPLRGTSLPVELPPVDLSKGTAAQTEENPLVGDCSGSAGNREELPEAATKLVD